MLTPEESFIKDLSDFLIDELEFNDVIIKKLNFLLKNYRSKISNIEYIQQNFFVYKSSIGLEVTPFSELKILDKYSIDYEFKKYCEERGINSDQMMQSSNGRAKKQVTNVRMDFCNYAAQNFIVNKSELAAYFGLNHSTIHYYFHINNKNQNPPINGGL